MPQEKTTVVTLGPQSSFLREIKSLSEKWVKSQDRQPMQHGLLTCLIEYVSHTSCKREKKHKDGIGGKDEQRKKRFQGIDGGVRRKGSLGQRRRNDRRVGNISWFSFSANLWVFLMEKNSQITITKNTNWLERYYQRIHKGPRPTFFNPSFQGLIKIKLCFISGQQLVHVREDLLCLI